MLTQIKRQPSMLGIAAGNTAAVNVPTTGTHYSLFLECLGAGGVPLNRAQIIADVGNIVVRIDGTEIYTVTATFLLDLQLYYGQAIGAGFVAGYIPIYFAPMWLPSFAERSIYALGTNNIGVISVEVQVVAVAVLTTINVYSEVTPEIRPLGQHIRIKQFPQVFGVAAGIQEITTLPKEGNSVAYKALHIQTPGASIITQATVQIGGNAIFDQVTAGLDTVLLAKEFRTVQPLYYHVDFAKNRDLTSFLPMAGVQDFRQNLTWAVAAPNNYNIYAEQIWGLNVK
jgi:hypothetical protein